MKKWIIVMLLSVSTIVLFGDDVSKTELLSLKYQDQVVYISDLNQEYTARYYALSDNSYHLVELFMPDGKKYTLLHVISGSGAKYMNNEIIWWTKGDSAFIELRDDQGEWNIYSRCKRINKT